MIDTVVEMIILAHRGYWKKPEEKNTLEAFKAAFESGYGVETDVRDFKGDLVISHDVPSERSLSFNDFLKLYVSINSNTPLALNIKSDGIQSLLMQYMDKYHIANENYFVFDMSVPKQVVYVKQRFPAFTRQSEFELTPVMYEHANGVWMDEFEQEWISENIIRSHLENRKRISIISPEIHHRDERQLWEILNVFKNEADLMLCTDIPKKAEDFFHEKD